MALHFLPQRRPLIFSDADASAGPSAEATVSPPARAAVRALELPTPIAAALRQLLLGLARHPGLGKVATRLPPIRRFARRFVAGSTLHEARAATRALNERGIAATMSNLGENVETTTEAFTAAGAALSCLDAIAADGLRAHVSVKLTQMGLDLDPGLCQANVARVLERARRAGSFVRIDMEGSAYTRRTLETFRRLRRDHDNVGVVIQAYLRRSQADVEDLIRERTRVRLCKGAYAEPPSVALTDRAAVDRNYRLLMERLLVDGEYPALATHDEALIEHAIAFARGRGVGPGRFEFQVLFGVRRDLQERLVAQGYNVRVYVPYGRDWYRYFMRRLVQRPANLLFFLSKVGRG